MSQNWIVKNSLDQISGPFDTSEIIRRIHQELITENDFVASYPEGRWIPVTKNQVFFDEMLDALSKGISKKGKSKNTLITSRDNKKGIRTLEHELNLDQKKLKTQNLDKKKSTRAIQESSGFQKGEGAYTKGSTEKKSKTSSKTRKTYSQGKALDLKKYKNQVFLYKIKPKVSVFLFICILLGIGFFFWPEDLPEHVKFIPPRFNSYVISTEVEQEKIRQAIFYIKKGGYKNFVKAHNELNQVLESQSSQIEPFSLLCFTYLHLWKFSKKTPKDLRAVSVVVKKALEIDRFGERGKICKFVYDQVREKHSEAEKVVNDVIDSEEGSSSIIFNYFSGLIKASKSDFSASEAYLAKAISESNSSNSKNREGEFAVMWLNLADVNLKLDRSKFAYRAVQKALTINPQYVEALFLKGIIEYIHQGNVVRAEGSLKTGLAFMKNDKSNIEILSEAYLVLAQISLSKEDPKKSLRYAISAYKYNPGNSIARNLAIRLGGRGKLGDKKVFSRQLFLEGEKSLKEVGCSSAQALFKEAFKLDPKNGQAALETAKCLWSLRFSADAIRWIEKAIQVDSNLMEAYLVAANFYIERYNFEFALRVLLKGLRKFPRSYEIYTSLAELELKKKNPELAEEYAKKALKIYDVHTKALVAISKAYLAMDKNQGAFRYIVRAIENDARNVEAHVVYGQSLYRTQGIYTAQQYLENRINSYPLEESYRVALAKLYLEDQKFKEAEEKAREALEFNENSKEALMVLGEILKARGKNALALNSFLDAFSVDPTDVKPIFKAGKIYFSEGQLNNAIKQFKRLISINPNYPGIYYNLAKAYRAKGYMDGALESCNYEIKNYPQKSECFVFNAEIYFHKGHKEKSKLSNLSFKKVRSENMLRIEEEKKVAYNQMLTFFKLCSKSYQKAIDITKPSTQTYINISKCYRLAGEFDLSQKMVDQAMKLESGNPVVWKESGFLLEQKGEYSLAFDAYKKYLIFKPTAEDREDIANRMTRLVKEIEEPPQKEGGP